MMMFTNLNLNGDTMRVIPSSATQNTVNLYRALNRMSKSEIINMSITDFAGNFNLSYAHVRNCVRSYRAINGLF